VLNLVFFIIKRSSQGSNLDLSVQWYKGPQAMTKCFPSHLVRPFTHTNQNACVDCLCRVDERGLVKVADFGLSRELIVQDYYRLCHSKTPVPVRWMAPESLSANVFTTMSDVVRLPY